jgi:sensor domain CHASE-containing protein
MLSRTCLSAESAAEVPSHFNSHDFFIALGANIIWVAELDQAEQSEQAAALSEIAIMQSHALESRIRENLAVSYAVAAHIKEKHGEAAQFQQFANALIPFYPGVAAIYLAPGGITSVVIPKEQGEVGLGLNLLTNPKHETESRIALQSGQLTLAARYRY